MIEGDCLELSSEDLAWAFKGKRYQMISQDPWTTYIPRKSEAVRKSQASARIFRIFWLARKSHALSMYVSQTCLTHGP